MLTGSGLQGVGGIGGAANSNIQYGFESTCPGGINQNTALLATAAAIGDLIFLILSSSLALALTFLKLS